MARWHRFLENVVQRAQAKLQHRIRLVFLGRDLRDDVAIEAAPGLERILLRVTEPVLVVVFGKRCRARSCWGRHWEIPVYLFPVPYWLCCSDYCEKRRPHERRLAMSFWEIGVPKLQPGRRCSTSVRFAETVSESKHHIYHPHATVSRHPIGVNLTAAILPLWSVVEPVEVISLTGELWAKRWRGS
jgi:hypothetical protein